MNFTWPKDRPYDVVGIGRNSWDRIARVRAYPAANSKVEALELDNQPGGQVATTVVTAARLGARARYLGKFGDDAGGRAVRGALVREGIDLSESKVVPGVSNQSAFIVVDAERRTRNVFSFTDPRLRIHFDDFSHEAVTSGRILYVGGRHPLDVLSYARLGRETGCIVAVDADSVVEGTAELLSYADIVVCPETFPTAFTDRNSIPEGIREIAEIGPSLVCCTRGEHGAYASAASTFLESPAFEVNVVDTTGAGDVFQGALLVGLLEGMDVPAALRFSTAAAALKCGRLGAQRGIPTRAEVMAFLESRA